MNVARMLLIAVIFIGNVSSSRAAFAAEEPSSPAPTTCPICRQANNQQAPYAEKAGSTLVRGAINTAFGWTELLVQPTEEVNRGGNLATGVGKGIGLAIKRTALGLGELLTFWTPKGKEGHAILARDCPICFSTSHQPPPSQ
jgi:putative exosortase-associated protein (TIGR04073 family)